ncbi:hypothetical protein Zmor_027535, partial [Zophobas morio]
MNVEGKVVLITGGTNGIGLAVAKILLKHKAKGVSLVDVDENTTSLDSLSSQYGNKVLFIKADVTIHQELEAAFEKT